MGEWKKVKLGDCIKEVVEKTTENNQYEVLTSSKDGIFSQEEYFDKQVASKNNVGYKIIKKGQFTYRSMSDSGRFTINKLDNKDIGIVSPAYPVFEAKEINSDYLKYFFDSEMFKKAIHNLSQGSTRTALKYKDLTEIEMFIPSIAEQKKIVHILENVDLIIKKYEELLKEKNKFITSQFVEMFGNPFFNNKGLDYMKMPCVCEIIDGDRGKNYPKAEDFFDDEYCLFINAKNVTSTGFSFENCVFITKEKDELLRKGKLQRGDIVLTTRGTIGNLAFYTEDIPFENIRINSGMVILRMKKNIVNEIFFIEQFKIQLENIKNKIISGSAQPQLPITTMNGINVLIPKIELQNKFADLVKLVYKQKNELERIIENYKRLKKGLMQQLLTGKIKVKI